jgi:hypothetical protein
MLVRAKDFPIALAPDLSSKIQQLKTEKLVAKWSTAPADKPHDMAMVPGTDQVLIVGETGKLASSI